MSLRCNTSEWLEVQRLDTDSEDLNSREITVCDSRVLLFGRGRHTFYVFVVSAKHTLHDASNVTLQIAFNGVACTRLDNDTLVAFTYWNKASFVFLQRLASLPLASVSFTAPYPLLFRRDLLLVADWNRATGLYTIVSFRASVDALTERRVLLYVQAGVDVDHWVIAGD